MESFKIGQVAKQSGLCVETVRFYEREGLIEEPPRQTSGYRAYPGSVVSRVREELVESLVEEAVRWASESVDLVDEKTAPGLGAAPGILLGIVLGAACWLVIIAAGYLVLTALS